MALMKEVINQTARGNSQGRSRQVLRRRNTILIKVLKPPKAENQTEEIIGVLSVPYMYGHMC